MQKISQTISFIILFISLASIVIAAPMPWGIAINPKTKECAGY